MKNTIASICSGGGILEQGAIAAGLNPIWAVEINPLVADLYQINYPESKIFVEDCRRIDWSRLRVPSVLHASPSCRNFSLANTNSESTIDIGVGQAIARAIALLQPETFTLENVAAYADSQAWELIFLQLKAIGYKIDFRVQKMKHWGVPQKQRNRFIAVANKSRLIKLVPPKITRWWYEEIEDLVSGLETSTLTNTQQQKLSADTLRAINAGTTVLLKRNQIREKTPAAHADEANCWTVTATLCTDQKGSNRRLFADLVTSEGIFSLNSRCLARIQTVPDSYKLSGLISIDGLAIGDGVPSFFAENLYNQCLTKEKVSNFPEKVLNVLFPKKENQAKLLEDKALLSYDDECKLLEIDEKLSSIEDNFENLEQIIEQNLLGEVEFYKLGLALNKIKTAKLYKEKHTSFGAYCRDRFSLSRSYVANLIQSAEVYQQVLPVVSEKDIELNESHCRSLAKIHDKDIRAAIVLQLSKHDRITAKGIEQEYRNLRLAEINERQQPDLPDVGSVVRLTSKLDPLTKRYSGYWGTVVEKYSYTVDIRILNKNLSTVHPQDFVALPDVDSDWAIALLDRLDLIYQEEELELSVKILLRAIASKPFPQLSKVEENLLKCLEKQKFS